MCWEARLTYSIVETRVETLAGHSLVHVIGEVDQSSAPVLSDALSRAVVLSPNVLVDLGDVGFIDSSGLSALIKGMHEARAAGGQVELVRPTAMVNRLLEITNLSSVFPTHDGLEDALNNTSKL